MEMTTSNKVSRKVIRVDTEHYISFLEGIKAEVERYDEEGAFPFTCIIAGCVADSRKYPSEFVLKYKQSIGRMLERYGQTRSIKGFVGIPSTFFTDALRRKYGKLGIAELRIKYLDSLIAYYIKRLIKERKQNAS